MTTDDREYISRAISVALEAERRGNLPVGAVVTFGGEVVAEAGSSILTPIYHPGRHAETEALRRVPDELWPRSREMTCYTTLEPCVMCFGALLLHGVGRVVFGARDREGGAGALLSYLPPLLRGRARRAEVGRACSAAGVRRTIREGRGEVRQAACGAITSG